SDVLRFSQNYSGGTARSLGLGGAFGALGGDATSLSINPAGIGIYRSSEFTITTGVNYDKVDATFLGSKYNDSKYKMNLSNLAYIYTYNTNNNSGWISASFGIAYNRLADFNRNIFIKKLHAPGSLLDEFGENLNGGISSDPYEGLALDADLIYKDVAQNKYFSRYTADDFPTIEKSIRTKGGMGEYDFSFGGNISHVFYFGATVGIQRIDYEEIKDHSEYDDEQTNADINSFSFKEHFNAFGTGVNLKLGAIVKPVEFLRVGVALHTPTFYKLNSEFYTTMDSYFDQGTPASYNLRSAFGENDFNLNTPLKAIGSLAFIFGKYGLFSVDYEYLDYSAAHTSSDNDNMHDLNSDVENHYKSASNVRAGLEGKLGIFAARVGYGYYGNPYSSGQLNSDYKFQSYSAGVGVRGKTAFFDVAYVLNKGEEYHRVYKNESAKLDIQQSKIMATLGFKF
ncbi:MAG TPA: hypothetical protein VHO90_11980, partial [Bacteroidales bacterium]|nr:hypothetical protein [Bacteroidales bacterium]